MALTVTTLLLCDGGDDQLFKDFEIHVAERSNVQASLAPLVFAELRKQLLLPEDMNSGEGPGDSSRIKGMSEQRSSISRDWDRG